MWLDISTSFNDGDHGAAYVARIGWLPDGSVYAQVCWKRLEIGSSSLCGNHLLHSPYGDFIGL